MAVYDFVTRNPQALKTSDLFIGFKFPKKTIYRMPYPKRFNKEESCCHVFEEFIRIVLLDIIENNTTFAFTENPNIHSCIKKDLVEGEEFMNAYKAGRMDVDYLKSNFTGHWIRMEINKRGFANKERNVFLSGDLKNKRNRASEIW